MALKIRSYHQSEMTIDGSPVTFHLRRMNVDEFIEFESGFQRYGRGESPAGVDEAKHEAEARTWLTAAFTNYVSLPKGEIVDEDLVTDTCDGSITEGPAILRYFGARREILITILLNLYLENKLSESAKKALRSPTGSAPTSSEQTPTAIGDGPDSPATLAGRETSADLEDATAPSSDESSGTTSDSSPAPVPSEPSRLM